MYDTVIVSGGNIEKDFVLDFLGKMIDEQGRDALCIIAADKGLELFMHTGIHPDIAVGDFDSLSDVGRGYLQVCEVSGERTRVIRLKPEKDDSDTQSALCTAVREGAKEILIFGATGSRLDHVLANLELLSWADEQGVSVALADANNWITLIGQDTVLRRDQQFGNYVSFFPVGGDVPGLTLEGFKYPLNRHYLKVSDCGLTVSNEIAEPEARVTYESGRLLMIMSRD